MKLNCGPEPVVKEVERQIRLTNWHPFFALWPRRVGPDDCRWLETIYRKGTWIEDYDLGRNYSFWSWEYISREQEYAEWCKNNP